MCLMSSFLLFVASHIHGLKVLFLFVCGGGVLLIINVFFFLWLVGLVLSCVKVRRICGNFRFRMLFCCSISMLLWDLVGGFLLSTCFEAKLTMDLLLSEWLNYSHAEGWSFIIKSPTFACLWLDLVSYKLLYRVCFISVITFVFYIDLSPSLNTISCLLM